VIETLGALEEEGGDRASEGVENTPPCNFLGPLMLLRFAGCLFWVFAVIVALYADIFWAMMIFRESCHSRVPRLREVVSKFGMKYGGALAWLVCCLSASVLAGAVVGAAAQMWTLTPATAAAAMASPALASAWSSIDFDSTLGFSGEGLPAPGPPLGGGSPGETAAAVASEDCRHRHWETERALEGESPDDLVLPLHAARTAPRTTELRTWSRECVG
jgi:hypothetical protein